mmetsp:Transcript_36429/g.72224  ORF Transcript_36429/g.72224 Transcript_36429/m.72224 type:complete len:103 (-) Transcript_36429:95-403(-)
MFLYFKGAVTRRNNPIKEREHPFVCEKSDEDDEPFYITQYPGIGLDKNDPRNIKLLHELEDHFSGLEEDRGIPHDKKKTENGPTATIPSSSTPVIPRTMMPS